MAKTVFNEVFKRLVKFLGIRLSQVADNFNSENSVTEDTLRSWQSRGVPKKSNYDELLNAMRKCVTRERAMSLNGKTEKLNDDLKTIYANYGLNDGGGLAEDGKLLDENIASILNYAYENSKKTADGARVAPQPVEAVKGGKPSKIVAFDLDGTLIKGFRYSWTVLWHAIGSTGKEAVKFKRDFEFGRISYQDWVEKDCEELQAGGLTLEKVHKAVKDTGCALTKNLVPAIQKLKENNCKVAIISGGADCILYDLLPEADKLFDEIYINRLKFDERTGFLKNIIATPYDWDEKGIGVEGKQAGLVRLCDKYGVKLENTAFVGNDFNDIGVMSIAGMKIFYYSYDAKDPNRGRGNRPEIRKMPQDVIYEPSNDLMLVANRIINWDFGDSDYVE